MQTDVYVHVTKSVCYKEKYSKVTQKNGYLIYDFPNIIYDFSKKSNVIKQSTLISSVCVCSSICSPFWLHSWTAELRELKTGPHRYLWHKKEQRIGGTDLWGQWWNID